MAPKTFPQALQPWQPTDAQPWNAARAGHLLNRAGFGGTRDEILAVAELGLVRAIDKLLDFPDAPAAEQTRDLPDESPLENVPRLNRERTRVLRSLPRDNPTARQLQNQEWGRASREFMTNTFSWWLDRMAYGPHPLQEKLTLYWHGHFCSSFRDDRQGSWRLWNQNELLRTHAAGNFRDFVLAVGRDPAMIQYLNSNRNVKASPNENYARELMELFTLGVGNYSENDIKQVARAFTGYNSDGVDFLFRQRQHDDGTKQIFGRTGNYTGDDVVDMLMQHPACARYIGTRMWKYFVGAQPSEEVVEGLAAVLRDANYEMRPLLRTIFNSRGFFDEARIGGKIKEPVQLIAGTCRMLGVEVPSRNQARNEMEKMGQTLFAPPNVKGWPGQFEGRRWINTSTLLARYNFGVAMAENADLSLEGRTPDTAVDDWLATFIPRGIDPAKRQTLVDTLAERPNQGGALTTVRLILSLPEHQLC